MQDTELPVISDPFYMKSTWYQETISGIKNASKTLRSQNTVRVYSAPITDIDLKELPPVVIVTNGSQAYVKSSIKALMKAGKFIVLSGLDSEQFGEMISCATSSRRTDMERLVHYLIGHNRRKIALVGFWHESINDMLFYHAAMSASLRYDAPIAKEATYFWDEHLTESLVSFMKDAHRYDAAICPNDTVALCLVNYCKEKNIDIPGDLYLTGISNMHIGRYCDPSLTTIAMDFNSIGEETLNVWHYVHDHLPRPTSIKVLVPGKLIVRASTDFRPELPFSQADGMQNEMSNDSPDNQFFTDLLITSLIQIENCLSQRDELDQKILIGIMQGKSYEALAEELFISISAIRYRRNKIFKDADVKTRAAFEHLMRENIGPIGNDVIE